MICFSGLCENFSGSYSCQCPAGWTGQTCGELINHCTDNMCLNGGLCINSVSGFTCDCQGTGFQGTNCDININDCTGEFVIDKFKKVFVF